MIFLAKIIDIYYCEEKVNNIMTGIIKLFVRTKDRQALTLVYPFKSYFYIYTDDLTKFRSNLLKIKNKPSCEIISAKSYCGFNNQKQEFIKCQFNCNTDLNKFIKSRYNKFLFENTTLYESDIDPKLRFIHLTHVNPAGIIQINDDDYNIKDNVYTYNKSDIPNLKNNSTEDIPYLITSFDIECDSVTGNFPLAEKSYEQFFSDIFTWFNKHLFTKSIYKNVIFKVRNNKQEQLNNWNKLLDILLDKDYFKLSIGSTILKIINCNDTFAEKVIDYMLTNQADIPQEVKNILDSNIIPAIKHTSKYTNVKTYEQLVKIAVKILRSGLPTIDIDPLTLRKKSDYENFNKDILNSIFEIGYENNFNWKSSANSVRQYFDKLPILEGDHVIQIGTVSQWSNEEFPFDKAIFMLGDTESFNNIDLINLENNNLQKEHKTIFPQKELDNFFKINNIEKPDNCDYDTQLAIMKQWSLNNQHNIDHANVSINVFDTNYPQVKTIIKLIAKHVNKFKPEQTNAQCCNYINQHKYSTLDNILNCMDDYCQLVCDEINNIYNVNIIYKNQTIIDIIMIVVNSIAKENIHYFWGGEKELLDHWRIYVNKINPDIITGYNIFSFDYTYLFKRAHINNIKNFGTMSKLKDFNANDLTELALSSSALGDNILRFPETPGRVLIDMYKFIQKDYALDSYKLDDVSTLFLYKEKANVPPQEIFYKQHGSNKDRQDVAMYCILDCILPINLMRKLDVIQKNVAMANVCKVPMNFLFTRGQGIKLFSLVLYYAHNIFADDMLLIKTKQGKSESTGYEGAIVFEPKKGFHTTPTAVGDFNSLYPNSMIARNISHDTIVDSDSPFANEDGTPNFELLNKFGYTTFTVEYDDNVYIDNEYINDDGSVNKEQAKNIYNLNNLTYVKDKGWLTTIKKQCTFVQSEKYRTGLLPEILKMLLKARKDIRKKMATETDPFHKNVLDTMQLAYKITANSLYGQTGAATSKIFKKEVAASTTAIGRSMVLTARRVFESLAGSFVDIPDRYDKNNTWRIYIKEAETRAGDTDSCMTSWLCFWDQQYTKQLDELDAIWACMNICKHACDIINSQVPSPEHIEFEKVICPFAIFAKKRYHGHYYVDGAFDDPYHPKFFKKSMGIVLKRRDNAHILKDIYNKCLSILMEERNVDKAFTVLEQELQTLDKRPIEDFVITKTLKSNYKLDNVAHVMLAERQAARDPGNRFETNDRIPFVYFYSPVHNNNTLQGDRIETPEYMQKYNKTIDYAYYIDKQLKKPLGQIFCDLLDREEQFNNIIKNAIDKYKVNTITNKTYKIDIDYQSDDSIEQYTCKFN